MSQDRFEIGEYYLVKHNNSPVYKAGWFDASTGQTRRISLGTKDFYEAKIALAEFVLKKTEPKDAKAADMPLGLLFYRYWEGHAKLLASSEAARYALALWTEFWADGTLANLTPHKQKEFMCWLKQKGYKNSYVSRVLAVGRAAIRTAWKNGEISVAPFIFDEPDRSDERETYILKPHEMRLLLMEAQELPHVFLYCMIATNTLARPEAVLDLAPSQVNINDGFINLNPKGRRQNKKYRPIVPITDTLKPFVQSSEVPAFVLWRGRPVKDIGNGFSGAVARAGLSKQITPYSLRHTMATELRRRSVPSWEIEGLLGHRRPTTTEKYAQFQADYLSAGREAIDAYFRDLKLVYRAP